MVTGCEGRGGETQTLKADSVVNVVKSLTVGSGDMLWDPLEPRFKYGSA